MVPRCAAYLEHLGAFAARNPRYLRLFVEFLAARRWSQARQSFAHARGVRDEFLVDALEGVTDEKALHARQLAVLLATLAWLSCVDGLPGSALADLREALVSALSSEAF